MLITSTIALQFKPSVLGQRQHRMLYVGICQATGLHSCINATLRVSNDITQTSAGGNLAVGLAYEAAAVKYRTPELAGLPEGASHFSLSPLGANSLFKGKLEYERVWQSPIPQLQRLLWQFPEEVHAQSFHCPYPQCEAVTDVMPYSLQRCLHCALLAQ